MKTFLTVVMVLLLAAAGCGQKEDSAEETKQPEASEPAAALEVDLHTAAATGNIEAIRKHIEAGSDLNVKDKDSGGCPMNTAALFGQTQAVMTLIEAGADINCRGNDGGTPLHIAAFFCHEEVVRVLVDKGADMTIKNAYGSTPREAVSAPFETVKPVYEHFTKVLAPLGLKLDLARIERTRPKIMKMLE